MDVRDGYLNELSDYAELEITRLDNNVVEVSVKTSGGDQQVVGSTPVSFTAIKDTLTEGKIKGINDANTTLTSYLSSIDSFVETLATDMNSIHNTSGGGALFTFTAGSAASTIEVASDVLNGTRRLNVGDVANPGDGTLASQFADFSTSAMSNGKIPQEEYNEFLVTLGTDIGNIQNKVTSRMAVLDQLEIKRESLSGVSIDEETVDLMTFQQSYEANAKVMNVVQEMMDTLLGIFR
jgi:flagellar hook-associated protein 1 FlgK